MGHFKLTEKGRIFLFLLSDKDKKYFPKNMEELLTCDYSDEWMELLGLKCIGFVKGEFGPYTCAFRYDMANYRKCLEYIISHETNQVIPDSQIRRNLREIGAIKYS